MTTETRRTYSVPEVAEILGVSPKTLYKAVRSGHIKAVGVYSRIVIPMQVVEELLANGNGLAAKNNGGK